MGLDCNNPAGEQIEENNIKRLVNPKNREDDGIPSDAEIIITDEASWVLLGEVWVNTDNIVAIGKRGDENKPVEGAMVIVSAGDGVLNVETDQSIKDVMELIAEATSV